MTSSTTSYIFKKIEYSHHAHPDFFHSPFSFRFTLLSISALPLHTLFAAYNEAALLLPRHSHHRLRTFLEPRVSPPFQHLRPLKPYLSLQVRSPGETRATPRRQRLPLPSHILHPHSEYVSERICAALEKVPEE